jgi:Tfp pilus assembly protein PilN
MVFTIRARLAEKTALDVLLSHPRREREPVRDAKSKKLSALTIVMVDYILERVILAYDKVRIASRDQRNYLLQTSSKTLDAKIAAITKSTVR